MDKHLIAISGAEQAIQDALYLSEYERHYDDAAFTTAIRAAMATGDERAQATIRARGVAERAVADERATRYANDTYHSIMNGCDRANWQKPEIYQRAYKAAYAALMNHAYDGEVSARNGAYQAACASMRTFLRTQPPNGALVAEVREVAAILDNTQGEGGR